MTTSIIDKLESNITHSILQIRYKKSLHLEGKIKCGRYKEDLPLNISILIQRASYCLPCFSIPRNASHLVSH